MKTEEIIAANIKCSGCADTIKKELLSLEGVKSVDVDIEKRKIKVSSDNIERAVIINKLLSIGYPETAQTQ